MRSYIQESGDDDVEIRLMDMNRQIFDIVDLQQSSDLRRESLSLP